MKNQTDSTPTPSSRSVKAIAVAAVTALSVVVALGLGATAIAPTVSALEVAGSVIAQDTRSQIEVTASAPRALTIKTTPNSKVAAVQVGSKKKVVTRANKQGFATLTKLEAGKTYSITTNGNTVTAIPVVAVSPASQLTVSTTASPNSLNLAWKHTTTRAQGPVSYRVSATPVDSAGTLNPAQAITNTVTTLDTTLVGLDTKSLFEFSVTPVNPLGDGQATVALMTRTLGDINGTTEKSADEKIVLTPKPAVVPAPAPAPAPVPVGPSTKTIYVCPEGFGDVGGVCTKSLPYTFTTENYTYHSETRIESCSGSDCPGSTFIVLPQPCNVGTVHADTCQYWSTGERRVNVQVKDATPAGFTDNGSAWVKKNATPAGYADNGTEWITTTAKVEKVVPV